MLRVGLEDIALQIMTLDLGEPNEFLSKALNPPSAIAMYNSLKVLERLGAVECHWRSGVPEQRSDGEEQADCSTLSVTTELTALGFHLASLPVEPRVGKMMIYGALFNCVDPALTIAASMTSTKPVFVSPFGQRDAASEVRQEFRTEDSDHLTVLTVFNHWRKLRQEKGDRVAQLFVKDKFLSRMTLFAMEDHRKHYASLLVDSGFLPKSSRLSNGKTPSDHTVVHAANANAGNVALLKAVLCAGLYPNILVAPRPLVNGTATQQAGETAFQSNSKGEVYLHPCTILYSAKKLESRYCCFHEIVRTSKMFVRDCTTVNPIALVLFGGSIEIYHREGVISVDEWLKFRISTLQATLMKHLRVQMESILLQKILSPEDNTANSATGRALIESISVLLGREHQRQDVRDGREIVRIWRGSQETNGRGGRGRGRGGRSGPGRNRNEN
jgi:HrpA-like RNA helicase